MNIYNKMNHRLEIDKPGQVYGPYDVSISRKKSHALITDPEEAKKHVLSMVKNQALNCHSGKQIPCEIDSICIHGDNQSSLATANSIKLNLMKNGLDLKPLNKMKKFI